MPEARDSDIFPRIKAKIAKTVRILQQLGYETKSILPKEFCDYMTAETPTGDTITLSDVLEIDFFMVHEVTEISELKGMNVPINERTIMDYYPKVCEAHFTAMENELTYPLDKGDYIWFKRRFGCRGELLDPDDPYLPLEYAYLKKEFAPCGKLIVRRLTRRSRMLFSKRVDTENH